MKATLTYHTSGADLLLLSPQMVPYIFPCPVYFKWHDETINYSHFSFPFGASEQWVWHSDSSPDWPGGEDWATPYSLLHLSLPTKGTEKGPGFLIFDQSTVALLNTQALQNCIVNYTPKRRGIFILG